jgi:hypothetical protein
MSTDNHDKEWADMKTNWQSTSIAETFMSEKLRWSLRLRMIGSWIWLGLEVASFILLAVLAAIQMAMGQSGVATALTLLNVVAISASVWARRSPLRSGRGTLLELIELAIQRTRRSERLAWAQYITIAACLTYVIAMYFSGVGDALAAYHDPGRAGGALTIFALYAVGVGFYHRYVRQRARGFLELRKKFEADDKD